jgi:hypothetical protein
MKKKFTRTNGKLTITQETIRRLSDGNMRAVNGGLQSGHVTCDSGFCNSEVHSGCFDCPSDGCGTGAC